MYKPSMPASSIRLFLFLLGTVSIGTSFVIPIGPRATASTDTTVRNKQTSVQRSFQSTWRTADNPSFEILLSSARVHRPFRSSSLSVSASVPPSDGTERNNDDNNKKIFSPKLVTVLWIHVLSIFMLVNYFWGAFPQFLFGTLSLPAWNFLHAISAMVFSGSIVTTTVLEWRNTNLKDNDNTAKVATQQLFPVEQSMVLPALSVNLLSGVAQVFQTYLPTSLQYAPPHVKSVFHVLFLFGLWWGFTDRQSQSSLEELLLLESENEVDQRSSGSSGMEIIEAALKARRLSNAVSCGFVVVLYAIMIFKPGY